MEASLAILRGLRRPGDSALPAEGKRAVEHLIATGHFREYDLHAFRDLDARLLASPDFEEEIVRWAHARFVEIVESGLLAIPEPGRRGPSDQEDEPLE